MRRLRGCVVISAIAGAVLGVLLLIVLFATGEMRFSYDAQVTQFFTCQGRDPSTGMPKQPITFPRCLQRAQSTSRRGYFKRKYG